MILHDSYPMSMCSSQLRDWSIPRSSCLGSSFSQHEYTQSHRTQLFMPSLQPTDRHKDKSLTCLQSYKEEMKYASPRTHLYCQALSLPYQSRHAICVHNHKIIPNNKGIKCTSTAVLSLCIDSKMPTQYQSSQTQGTKT